MFTDLPSTYELETVDQLRAIADELRQRIFNALIDQPMTVTQVGQRLDVAPAKIHYHMRELERVGLVHLHETREKGGILEKYYRPVARYISVPHSLLQSLSPDEHVALFTDLLNEVSRAFMGAVSAASESRDRRGLAALSGTHAWLTDAEASEVGEAIQGALEPYMTPRGVEGERERTLVHIMYDTRAAWERVGGDPPSESQSEPRIRRNVVAGATSWSREDLEKLVANGEQLDFYVLGLVYFPDDVTAELADKAIRHFRHRGVLSAPADVRAVLARKAAGNDPATPGKR